MIEVVDRSCEPYMFHFFPLYEKDRKFSSILWCLRGNIRNAITEIHGV